MKNYTMKTNKHGASIWEDDFWILDASLILKSGEVVIDLTKFNKVLEQDGKLQLKIKG